MDNKHIYIVLAIVVALFAGFLGYRHYAKKKDFQVHQADTYKRLTQMAKQNARAGLPQMGKALKRYYAANNTYPDTLAALYPEYITGKSFIDDVNWEYRPSVNNFYLGKSVTQSGKTLTASIDASLKTQSDSAVRAVAASGKPEEKPKAAPAPAAISIDREKIMASLKVDKPSPEKADDLAAPAAPRAVPRVISTVDTASPSGLASEAGENYLVWKYPDGRMGIGNVQYPHADQIDVAAEKQWFNVKRVPVTADADVPSEPPGESTRTGDGGDDFLARLVEGNYLAWKDKSGIVCFGNVQYPDPGNITAIFADGKWMAAETSNPL